MKSPVPNIVLLFLALVGVASADLPKKMPIGRYSSLWNNSPFTSKPPPNEEGPLNNPLDDYALIGISPIGAGGYRVTLINKKKPDERITVDSDSSKSGFKILGVTRKAGNPLGTVVRMSSGPMTGLVGFDEKLLTLASSARAAKPAAPQPGQPNQAPGQPVQPPQPVQRQPRPRVVPPPAPVPAGQGAATPQNYRTPPQRAQRRGN